jgi:hypothetical protein
VVQVIEYLPSNCNFKFQYHQKKRGGGGRRGRREEKAETMEKGKARENPNILSK